MFRRGVISPDGAHVLEFIKGDREVKLPIRGGAHNRFHPGDKVTFSPTSNNMGGPFLQAARIHGVD